MADKVLALIEKFHPTPWSLEQANDRGIRVEDARRITVLSRTFTDDDRRDFRDLMQEDLEFYMRLVETINALARDDAPAPSPDGALPCINAHVHVTELEEYLPNVWRVSCSCGKKGSTSDTRAGAIELWNLINPAGA